MSQGREPTREVGLRWASAVDEPTPGGDEGSQAGRGKRVLHGACRSCQINQNEGLSDDECWSSP